MDPVENSLLKNPTIYLQSRYKIFTVIDTSEEFYWGHSALFSDVMMLFNPQNLVYVV